MFSKEQLQKLRTTEIELEQRNHLVDIKTVQIDDSLKKPERVLKYMGAVGNPYLFRVGDLVVRVQYGNGNGSLQDCVANYLSSR